MSFRPRRPDTLNVNGVVLSNQEGCKKYPREYMKMLSYLLDRAADYGHLAELIIDPTNARACTLDRNITVEARMLHIGITMRMKPGVILGQQLAVQEDSVLKTIYEYLSTVTGS